MLVSGEAEPHWPSVPRAQVLTGIAADSAVQQAKNLMSGPDSTQQYRGSQALINSSQQQRHQGGSSVPNGYSGVAPNLVLARDRCVRLGKHVPRPPLCDPSDFDPPSSAFVKALTASN